MLSEFWLFFMLLEKYTARATRSLPLAATAITTTTNVYIYSTRCNLIEVASCWLRQQRVCFRVTNNGEGSAEGPLEILAENKSESGK